MEIVYNLTLQEQGWSSQGDVPASDEYCQHCYLWAHMHCSGVTGSHHCSLCLHTQGDSAYHHMQSMSECWDVKRSGIYLSHIYPPLNHALDLISLFLLFVWYIWVYVCGLWDSIKHNLCTHTHARTHTHTHTHSHVLTRTYTQHIDLWTNKTMSEFEYALAVCWPVLSYVPTYIRR